MTKTKVYNPEKVSLGKSLLWNTRPLSFGTVTILMGYLSMFCTDILQMPAALVGTLLMVSKIFDGVTDLIAGYIVDNTKTKLGKGRPYELCLIGVWVCTFALFASNVEWSMTMKAIWLLIMYTLIWSIFGTMLNAAETPYIFDEMMEVVKRHPDFKRYELCVESSLKLPGLEIYLDRRKIYRDRREICLTVR